MTATAFENLVRLIVYICSVLISAEHAPGSWVVGPVFGLAVVTWHSRSFKSFSTGKHAAFVAASTLIYALVYEISSKNWNRGSDTLDALVGSLPVAIAVGSLLLPQAHRLLLGVDGKKALMTTAALIGSYYVITAIYLILPTFSINYLFLYIAAWQGVYLYMLARPAAK
jgi:hypothetical protein